MLKIVEKRKSGLLLGCFAKFDKIILQMKFGYVSMRRAEGHFRVLISSGRMVRHKIPGRGRETAGICREVEESLGEVKGRA